MLFDVFVLSCFSAFMFCRRYAFMLLLVPVYGFDVFVSSRLLEVGGANPSGKSFRFVRRAVG